MSACDVQYRLIPLCSYMFWDNLAIGCLFALAS